MAEHLTKSALAQIVLPETIDDIEEYLKPEFSLKHQRRKVKEQDQDTLNEDEVHGRRIVMDGFGRWREIRPKKHIQIKKLELVDAESLPRMKQVFGMKSPVSSRCGSNAPAPQSRYDAYQSYLERTRSSSRQERTAKMRQESNFENGSVYNKLGMITRSNVFPGIGNYHWNTTTARTFTKKPITPVEDRKVFYGLQTDDFGVWAAANVLNERMKKAWGEYLETVPKAKANWEPPSTENAKTIPPVQIKPKTKSKKNPPKPKFKQENVVTNDTTPFQEQENLPSEQHIPPPYVPDNGEADDDDFWDFYDKPFHKPQK